MEIIAKRKEEREAKAQAQGNSGNHRGRGGGRGGRGRGRGGRGGKFSNRTLGGEKKCYGCGYDNHLLVECLRKPCTICSFRNHVTKDCYELGTLLSEVKKTGGDNVEKIKEDIRAKKAKYGKASESSQAQPQPQMQQAMAVTEVKTFPRAVYEFCERCGSEGHNAKDCRQEGIKCQQCQFTHRGDQPHRGGTRPDYSVPGRVTLDLESYVLLRNQRADPSLGGIYAGKG